MPLPEIPSLFTGYADLRRLCFIDRELVDKARRVASMSEEGIRRLHVQIVGFFTRRDFRNIPLPTKLEN